METTVVSWFDAIIVQPINSLLIQLAVFIPMLLGALAILLVGWFLAKLIERVVVRILKTITLDKLADQVQLSTVLAKGGVRYKLSELIGVIIYWLVMLAVVMAAFNALQLTVAAQLIQAVVAFMPNVLAAVFILIVGIFAAAFLSATVRTVASNSGILQSQLLGQFTQIAVVIFASVAALQQLRIQFFGEAFLIILSGISLGAALAFGLGSKDLAGKWLSDVAEQIQGRKR